MDTKAKQVLTISGIVFGLLIIGMIIYTLIPKVPATQFGEKTVIIDNYAEYTRHISSDSFGSLGNHLYRFIKDPRESVYHAEIVDGTYEYTEDSWHSDFVVQLKGSDISWDVTMQTLENGDINGDIAVVCKTGGDACVSLSDALNSKPALQDQLPLNSKDFIIAYQDDYDTLSVVYYEEAGKQKALDKIIELGFNPDDYTIEYFYGGR